MTHHFNKTDWRNYIFHYYRLTEMVDQEIGKLLHTLEINGLDKNTLIVFTSDHGDGSGAHQWAAKLSLYEESVKVPLIITKIGETPRGITDDKHLVSGLDILPTICDYANIEMPREVEGQSLKTIIENPDTAWRKFIVTELAPDPRNPDFMGRMVRTKNYKYCIYSHGKNNEQLFNLKQDPGELHNLAYNNAYQKILYTHRAYLKSWIEETDDTFSVKK